jgi:hypothetical protein
MKNFVKKVATHTLWHGEILPFGAIYGRTVCRFADGVNVEVEWYCESQKTYGKANDYYIYIYDNRIGKWKEINTSYSKGYAPIKAILRKVSQISVRNWHDFKELDLPYMRRVGQYT